jgi:hypothetical protein
MRKFGTGIFVRSEKLALVSGNKTQPLKKGETVILDELKQALHAKGFFYEERISEDAPGVPVVWATDRRGRDYSIGVKESVLSLPLERFLQKEMYAQLGRVREDLIDAFVGEMFWLFERSPDETDTVNLKRRTQRLYDELRRADW